MILVASHSSWSGTEAGEHTSAGGGCHGPHQQPQWDGKGMVWQQSHSRADTHGDREIRCHLPLWLSASRLFASCFFLLQAGPQNLFNLSFHSWWMQLWLPIIPSLVCDVGTGGVFGTGMGVPLPTGEVQDVPHCLQHLTWPSHP